jgi:hypothetical protein
VATNDAPPGVFICYRHEDSPGQALRVYQLLSARLGEDRVSMDVTIPPAVDFVDWIERSIGAAGVVIAIIGRSWLALDADGRRRIDDDDDFVRREIAGALVRGMEVLPVLVDDAEMPSEKELPASLERLPYLNAHVLRSDSYWRESDEKLAARVTQLLGDDLTTQPVSPVPPPAAAKLPASVTATGLAGITLLALGLILLWETYITPGFRYLPIAPGFFTAAAPLGVLVGAAVVVAHVRRHGKGGWLDVGLLAGFGFEAAAKGASLLDDSAGRVQAGGVLWLAGGAALAAAAWTTATHLRSNAPAESKSEGPRGSTVGAALVGAGMLVVGTAIPFNVAKPNSANSVTRTVASDSLHSIETIGTALLVVAAVALLLAGRERLAAGLLIALGVGNALLWLRYAGIPVAQWLHTDGVAAPRSGGFVGLAGSLLVLAAGWRLAVSSRAEVPAAEPLALT